MKRISSKIFLVILCCSLVTVVILGWISLARGNTILKQDSQAQLGWMARDYAARFSAELLVIEDKLQELELHVLDTIDLTALKNDPNYLARYEAELNPFVKYFAEDRTAGGSGWVYFNPKWSDTPHDVYYADGNADGISERQPHIPFSYFDNTPLPNDDKEWWYGPRRTGEIFWSNPYEWPLADGQNIRIVSCSVPVYLQGEFIGVVGTSYRFGAMSEEIQNIPVYESGAATLLNEKLDFVVSPTYTTGNRYTSDNLLTVENGRFFDVASVMLENEQGVLSFGESEANGIAAYAKLSNGWILTLHPELNELYASLNHLMLELLTAIVACVLFSFVAAWVMGKYLSKPILQVAAAAKQIGTGDLSVVVEVSSEDEVSTLATSLNSMTHNIKALQAELFRQAYCDELTGGKTMARFKLDAHDLLSKSPDEPYMLIKCDVERFKVFNEMYGFAEGDRILKNIAMALNLSLDPAAEFFCRIYADEFLVLLRADSTHAVNARRLQFSNIFRRLNENSYNYRITYAIGQYVIPKGETDMSVIFERVNLAHQLSKETPDLKVCDYDASVRQLAVREKEMENQMEDALKNGEFVMYLQPKYLLSDESICGAEALVRWQTDNPDLLYPASFIPLFERNGFITKIDYYIYECACQTIRAWIDSGATAVSVSVNFSRLHISNPRFLDNLCRIADRYAVPRHLLEIELTETVILANVETLVSFLEKLHSAGFTLSMDDFGTGYSSLGLLKNLPVNVIKIDRSFFLDATDHARSRAVIETIIEMSKKLNIHTVAEGVEEQQHIDLLRELGCDIVQGHYFSKPMPAPDFARNLTRKDPEPKNDTQGEPV